MERFSKVTLYTWERDKDNPFPVARLFKNGKPHSRIARSDANAWCEKWNGRRGDFQRKPNTTHNN
jgi:hypothetical protein